MGRSVKQEHNTKDVVSARDGSTEGLNFDFKGYKESIDTKYNIRMKL